MRRLPITFDILFQMCNALDFGMFNAELDLMLLCAFKTAFYGFLRVGEFTRIQCGNLTFVRMCDKVLLKDLSYTVTLRSSKTDPFGKGVYNNF